LTPHPFLNTLKSKERTFNINLYPYKVGYGYKMNLNPISEKGMGFCFIAIDEHWERFKRKEKRRWK